MPREGYADAITFQDVDFNGVLNVIINNKRFQTKFTDDLSKTSNDIIKAREVGKAFRHCPDLGVDDASFEDYIDILVNVLSDTKCLMHQKKAQDAVKILNELKVESLNVSSSDVTNAIEDFIKQQRQNLSEAANEKVDYINTQGERLNRQMQEAQMAFLREVANSANTFNQLTTDILQEIISSKICAIVEIEELAKREKRAVIKEGKTLKRKALKHKQSLGQESKRLRMTLKKEEERAVASMRRSASSSRALGERISESEDYPKLKSELRKDLIELCRKLHINLPVSPVREENEVPLLQFYVSPTLKCKEYEKGPYINQDIDQSRQISSYHEIFFKESKECQDIYLASPAALGKPLTSSV
ncbi:uncharacterized protein LOC123526247 [Mercenaria mercenaria]|uniref:uncharacterized protein LOC123526247 n=1 Tax=Mercenaria mercenaria TaxID=6596 RepID=UPI00234E6163|nr:uncharacterized protein LOC123526247 [Mercenaria mercenaria]XP_053378865.1 uncharacterized protein LOC123526247 [Mercenaria mercenaria]XP_053378866.1 uncharacterized protein LOC123526247 [Mercenaria mercenaria]